MELKSDVYVVHVASGKGRDILEWVEGVFTSLDLAVDYIESHLEGCTYIPANSYKNEQWSGLLDHEYTTMWIVEMTLNVPLMLK